MDMHHAASMMQFRHFSMGRSIGFKIGGTYHRPQQQQQQQQQHNPSVSSSGVSFSAVNNQDLLHMHDSDMFPSSHSNYHSQQGYFSDFGWRHCSISSTACRETKPNYMQLMNFQEARKQQRAKPTATV